MIKVNLLPHRERKRRQRQQRFYLMLTLCAMAGVLAILLVGIVFAQQIAAKRELNQMIRTEIDQLNAQIAKISDVRLQIATLKARQQTVENLQWEQNAPVYLLEELARLTPDGVQLRNLKQTQQRVTLQGSAQSGERVSEFLRLLNAQARWLEQSELVELRASSGTTAGSKPGYDFTVTVSTRKSNATPLNAP